MQIFEKKQKCIAVAWTNTIRASEFAKITVSGYILGSNSEIRNV